MARPTFQQLAGGPCPALADLLLAVADEFAAVDAGAADDCLDDHARRLFGLAARPALEQATRLVDVLACDLGYTADDGDDPALLRLDEVLHARRGHPLLLAAIASEAGARAGLRTSVLSSPARWFVGVPDGEHTVLVDARLGDACDHAPASVRGHCAHELAFCALTGLAVGYANADRREEARRAAAMRLELPIDADLRASVLRELDLLDRE